MCCKKATTVKKNRKHTFWTETPLVLHYLYAMGLWVPIRYLIYQCCQRDWYQLRILCSKSLDSSLATNSLLLMSNLLVQCKSFLRSMACLSLVCGNLSSPKLFLLALKKKKIINALLTQVTSWVEIESWTTEIYVYKTTSNSWSYFLHMFGTPFFFARLFGSPITYSSSFFLYDKDDIGKKNSLIQIKV